MPPVLDQNDIAFLDSCIHDYERLHGSPALGADDADVNNCTDDRNGGITNYGCGNCANGCDAFGD